ncbi:MAG: GTPase HflX [Candidatus Bipolaricaulota bacterium]|nr:GTPase HflX [Candidatus Bipolaricaulota bacterium]
MNEEKREGDRRPLVEDYLGARARVYGTEQAILVGVDLEGHNEDLLGELESLADTAGIPTLATVVQNRFRPDGATFIGKGKTEEVGALADEVGADVVIFNNDLSPGQARNLEEALGRKVIDRTQLILDIFAQRAATKEAKLQVELAQLRYLLPRLRGWGEALTHAGAGIGTRGPGETKLEIDRNKIHRRIHTIEKRLRTASDERAERRKLRERSDVPQVALVGYTNSGKSTLLNQLSGADAFVENKLFATLDTLVRRGPVAAGREALFIDTVGFIRDLPHQLVPAFAATLEAARYADLILHIVDVARPSAVDDFRSVEETLQKEVFSKGDERPPVLNVLNKIDIAPDAAIREFEGVAISAKEGLHLDVLREQISSLVYSGDRELVLLVPYTALRSLPLFRAKGRVEIVDYVADGARVRGRFSNDEVATAEAAGCRITSLSSSTPAA